MRPFPFVSEKHPADEVGSRRRDQGRLHGAVSLDVSIAEDRIVVGDRAAHTFVVELQVDACTEKAFDLATAETRRFHSLRIKACVQADRRRRLLRWHCVSSCVGMSVGARRTERRTRSASQLQDWFAVVCDRERATGGRDLRRLEVDAQGVCNRGVEVGHRHR